MNGKTAKKLLMRGRTKNFWGRRAYLTVRVPVALVPTPRPEPVSFEGLSESSPFGGSWNTPDYSDIINISHISCGQKPESRHPWEPVYFPVLEHAGTEGYQHWTYWSGARHRLIGQDAEGHPLHERTPIDEATVGRYRAFREWHDRLHESGLHPVLDALLVAGDAAKSTHFEVRGDDLLVTYGVKWFYPSRKYRFASGLARAFRIAKDHGVKIRAIKGLP